mgnify:CR=1 FL=1
MAMTKRPKRQYSSEIVNLEDMVPKDHFLRVIEEHFDWDFIYDEVEKLYSKVGRKSIDPVVLIKIHILKFLFHEDSLRRTCENLKYNNLYRWFIGYNLCEDVPDHSTYSQNYKRKFCNLEKDLLQTVFDKVIELLINWNCLDMTAVYIDSTHTKAYANKKKNHKEIVKIEAKKYQKELDLEITLKGLQEEDLTDEEYLEEVQRIVKCNEEVDTNGSNVHDSISFYDSFENLSTHHDISQIDYFVGDAAYLTPHICKTIIDLGMIPAFPYTRKGYRKDYLKKYEFVYDEYNNIYICPNEKELIPTERIDKNGYMVYKADEHDCSNCPFKEQCTKSKYKQILRHVWEEYKEMTNDYRHHEDVKEIYKQRPQHIERVFADGKMKYGLRNTYFRTKERVHRELTLLYACMNLKKFALHHYV